MAQVPFFLGFCESVLLWHLEQAASRATEAQCQLCCGALAGCSEVPCHPACVATLLLLSFCELIHVICSVSEHERRKENFQEIDYDLCGFVKNVPFQTEHEAASLTCSLPGDSLSSVFQLHSGHILFSSAPSLSLTLLRTWGRSVSGRSNQALLEIHQHQHCFSVQPAVKACYTSTYAHCHQFSNSPCIRPSIAFHDFSWRDAWVLQIWNRTGCSGMG